METLQRALLIDSDCCTSSHHSNRSASLLKLKKVTKALEDAEECIRLRPEWEKGYYRKAAVLEEQDMVEGVGYAGRSLGGC